MYFLLIIIQRKTMGVDTVIYHQRGLVFRGDIDATFVKLSNGWGVSNEMCERLAVFDWRVMGRISQENPDENALTFFAFRDLKPLGDHNGYPQLARCLCSKDPTHPNVTNCTRDCRFSHPQDQLILTSGTFMKKDKRDRIIEKSGNIIKSFVLAYLKELQEEDESIDVENISKSMNEYIDRKMKDDVVFVGKILMIYTR